MHSGEYQYDIHFESMREQANQSKRNITSGLSRGIHQSLQEVKMAQDDHLLVSNEHNRDSPILSNKLEYAQVRQQTTHLWGGEKSHENLQKRNNYPDLKDNSQASYGFC